MRDLPFLLPCSAQEKLQQSQREGGRQVQDLQTQLAEVTASRAELHTYIRELEQSNDDLERAKRATVASLEEFESKLNQAIERNAFLESELDDKEAMSCMVQRLKDEARDLKQELMIRQSVHKEETMPFLPEPTSPPSQRQRRDSASLLLPPPPRGAGGVHAPSSSRIPGLADSNRLATEGPTTPPGVSASRGCRRQCRGDLGWAGGDPWWQNAPWFLGEKAGDRGNGIEATTHSVLFEAQAKSLLKATLESKLASCRNFVKSPQKEDGDGTAGLVTALGRTHLKQRALSSPQEFVPLAF
ncbi:hypothetical protein HPB48_025197 [Haemaphysalis longicornis]|uniref:NUDE domain-containing protein n=1 Tax=Haemaphysalis longicornis TaxID=44386 RepID=A0A9J6H779_HAELO|nr:hypothetical protein HPB48_025197 [Haemaphysalis longicornis]